MANLQGMESDDCFNLSVRRLAKPYKDVNAADINLSAYARLYVHLEAEPHVLSVSIIF